MKRKTLIMLSFVFAFVFIAGTLFSMKDVKADGEKGAGRYNVVVVMDASGSLNETDNKGYRHDAVGLFVDLLPSKGNYVGSVIFSTQLDDSKDVALLESFDDKQKFKENLKSVVPDRGYTNIGAALEAAVKMLEKGGDKDLPSVIIFLSDGNTEMPDDDQLEESLQKKADALQKARNEGIRIFSVCLNADGSADTSEMRQLSEGTNGEFREVKRAEDLIDVFNVFYDLIYGTTTTELFEGEFPDNGVIEKNFDLPYFGVEEVNIVIYGEIKDVHVSNPSNNDVNADVSNDDVYTMVKFSDIVGGTWKLTATGDPGNPIKVNMVYNSNLRVNLDIDKNLQNYVYTDEDVEFHATLQLQDEIATTEQQYYGYSAKLIQMDNMLNVIKAYDMDVKDGGFYTTMKLDQGSYFYKTVIEGNYLNKESNVEGPVVVEEPKKDEPKPEEPKQIENNAPKPKDTPIEYTVYVIPFRNNDFSFEMKDLASDKDGDKLSYIIDPDMPPTVLEEDYEVDGDTVTVKKFGLRKEEFTIRAVDPYGEYCQIEIVIKSIHVGLITVIALSVIGIIVLVLLSILAYKKSRPLRGVVTLMSMDGMNRKGGTPIDRGHGSIRLAKSGIDLMTLKRSSHIQCTGKNFIYVIFKPFVYEGMSNKKAKKITVRDGSTVVVYLENKAQAIQISYRSTAKNRGPGGGGRGKSRNAGVGGPMKRPGSGGAGGPMNRPGGMPGGRPGGMPGGMPGGRPGGMPGGGYGGGYGGPGGMPRR